MLTATFAGATLGAAWAVQMPSRSLGLLLAIAFGLITVAMCGGGLVLRWRWPPPPLRSTSGDLYAMLEPGDLLYIGVTLDAATRLQPLQDKASKEPEEDPPSGEPPGNHPNGPYRLNQ